MKIKNKNIDHNKRLEKSLFLVPQKFQLDNIKKLDAEMTYVLNREAAQKSNAIEVDRNSLVKRCKSPTSPKPKNFAEKYQQDFEAKRAKYRVKAVKAQAKKTEQNARIKQEFEKSLYTCPEPISLKSRVKTSLSDYLKHTPRHTIEKETIFDAKKDSHKKGSIAKSTKSCVRLFSQDWSGKYKFNLVTGALGSKSAPPLACGERVTKELTKNASRNILESGAYMATARAGYTTFLTLTFNEKSRQDLEKLVPVNRNVTKIYRTSDTKEKYSIECFSGVPYSLGDTENIKNATRYSNSVEASGIFTPITFEPKTTIGKEVSRFFDGAQKIYQRGFVPESITEEKEYPWGKVKCQQLNTEKVEPAFVMYCPDIVSKKTASGQLPVGFENAFDFEKYNPRKHTDSEYLEKRAVFGEKEKSAPLDYMWVAEQPTNESGDKNPHVHVLMRWQVKPELFQAWAKRLEKLWGHGFAKLERIKTPEAASNYLLKAVGYLTKGAENDQGEIKGNRYGISASARAPTWGCIGEFYADNFLAILGELREKLSRKKSAIQSRINAAINQKSAKVAKYSTLKNVNKKTDTEKRQAHIARIKKQLFEDDSEIKKEFDYINNLPFVSEYSLGGLNEEQATNFLMWAMRSRWWNGEVKTNRYNQWQELKQNTIQAVKANRNYLKQYQHLVETRDLTWLWAEENSRYELAEMPDNSWIDENGQEWEFVS